ncbi:MAG TPA: ATP-binding cassette domain-containing protein, partial [Blastocatellia bacterium]|nr:ATP-binding cassette domain-containing protein [Blastocatellia bacterium]
PGEILLVTGSNGSGKSTLLKAIYGLVPPWTSDAEITFRPNPARSPLTTSKPTLNLSRGLAYLPQKYGVFEDLSSEDNLRLAGHTLHDQREFAARCEQVLASLPVLRRFLPVKPERMSGGERQMLALAMILLHRPKLLMLDEPTAGLDSENSTVVLDFLRQVQIKYGTALVVVEHRTHECATLGGRRLRMTLGYLEPEIPACEQSKGE